MADITIPRKIAEQLYDLYNNVASADSHYQRCQSDNFRMHVRSVYQNQGVTDAFAQLKAQLDAETAEKAKAAEGRQKARKGVLY